VDPVLKCKLEGVNNVPSKLHSHAAGKQLPRSSFEVLHTNFYLGFIGQALWETEFAVLKPLISKYWKCHRDTYMAKHPYIQSMRIRGMMVVGGCSCEP